MSTPEKTAPPTGEEIHLPGGSLQPIGLSIGITILLIGVTTSIILVIAGAVLCIVALSTWIRDARREFDELPAEHH